MANLQFVVTAVFNNTQLREGTEELKSTFSDLNHLNNSTLNTSNKQINKLQSEINDLIRIVDNIENRIEIRQRLVNEDKIELEVKKSDLEELQKSFGFLLGQVALNIAEDAKDARDTLTKRQISPNQIEDIIRANDPRNDINEIKALTAAVQLLIATQTKNSKERSLESNIFRSPRGPASNTRPLTSEERTKLLNDIAELDLQIHDLLLTLDQNISERIQRQFPDAFAALEKFREIRATQNEIGELETGILGTESKINQDKEFLEEVLRQLSSVQQKRDELGETFFPEIDLGIDEDTFNLENLSFPQMKLRLEPIDQKQFQEEIENTNEKINEQSNNFGILEGAIASADGRLVAGAGARSEFLINTEQTAEQLENEAESINNAGSGLETLVSQSGTFVGIQGQLNQKVGEGETALEGAGAAAAGYVEETKNASQALDSLGVFVGKISAQISETFSDFLFEGLKGNFDNFEDLFDDLMDTLLRSFTDFASAIITNPIRVSLEGSLKGDAGGGGIGGLFKGIGDALGPLGDLFKSGGPLASIGDFFGDLFAEGGALSFLGDIGSFLGPIGSAISAVASIAIPLIGGLLKKTPRLDLDFDQFRDEFGNSLEIAAEVQDFLNEDLFRNEIFNNSVSRQAGLGLGSELPNVIREAIEGQINAIQDIINQLPADLAAQLNESLLNTSVDIESEVKGDRLLEFDETKNIQEKFQQFINGDLQARFLFSIRDFFVGAFESLGVLGSAAQDFIDAEFEKFQGLSREERIEAGEELLQDFQTLTDAFNVLNNNGADSIGATVNSIKNLSSSLEFDGVPSIEELDAGLEELINAAELDPDVIQDYLDLRNAILEAQRAILSSISSIISSISSLNSIIVDGGGDAFDLTGFINDGLDSVTGLLG